jgi:tetratricopeptide (TPR) repeat protein
MADKSPKPPTPNDVKVTPAPAVSLPAPAGHAFQTEDWIAAATTFLISFAAFFYYMSPSITLQDSGELVTGAYNFGVPHPPGYPLWAFLGWVWRHLIPFGNPAWQICLMSVVTGALVVGVMTLFMTRSTLMLLRALPWSNTMEEKLRHWISLTVGASVSLLFGFNRGVWLWACVPEMRVLNVFFFTLLSFLFFGWMMRTEKRGFLYATLLVYGLGIANHQTVFVFGAPLLGGLFLRGWWAEDAAGNLKRDLSAFCEVLVALLFGWLAGVLLFAWLQAPPDGSLGLQKVKALILFGPEVTASLVALLGGGGAIFLLVFGGTQGWLKWKRALICTGLFLMGVGVYAYMPIAAATNPPMNWGYAATKQGFLHAITRGQYEKLHMSPLLSEQFRIQVSLFTEALIKQYSLILILIGIVPAALLFVGWKQIHRRARVWLLFIWAAFGITSIGLLTIINPGLDKQQQEINIKFFAPAHGFYAVLIGYGLATIIAGLLAKWPQLPRQALRLACVLLLLLPAISFSRNLSACSQRGHDFGYQFGYRMFYPGGSYPPMEKDAVLYGGTDPGRFVPTYMIFCESFAKPENRFRDSHFDTEGGRNFDRRDVYIITQNALADSTYMSYIRDHYAYERPDWNNAATITNRPGWQQGLFGWAWQYLDRANTYPKQPIWIPNEGDIQRAFQEYVQSLKTRQAGPDEQVEIVGGRVSVRGVAGVMNINGILTKWIFERNKDQHAFYVEESYVIPWMYPYLEPAGIILKINREPLPAPEQDQARWQQIINRDKAYWNQLVKEFKEREQFRRNSDAQKTFSKLRSAIGGLYANRRLTLEAEYAYRQARELCRESPEANFRLAQLYMELNRPDDAVKVLQELQELDPLNNKIGQAIEQIQTIKQARADIGRLETARLAAPADVQVVLQLAQAYGRAGFPDRIPGLCDSYLSLSNLPAGEMIQVAQLYLTVGQPDRAIAALNLILSRHPADSQSHYALAIIRGAMGQTDDALNALARAVQITPALRDQARNDARLNPLRNHPRFQQIVGLPGFTPFQ